VDSFVGVLEQYSTVPVAVVIEPDSLPNLATNLGDSKCGSSATQTAYVEGIRYAIESLSRRVPRAALYLDAGHGGWLGWRDKTDEFLRVVGRMGQAVSLLRGFATNVANYQSLGSPCPASAVGTGRLGQGYCQYNAPTREDPCCRDPCNLFSDFNGANNEHNYVQLLSARARDVLHQLPSPHFIIDTGRNGRDDTRSDCAHWCNIRGAAVGNEPTANTALPNIIDAYFWLKTPGESDGCTATLPNGDACTRYDGSCGSVDSIGSREAEPRAPEAGEWFAPQLAELSCRARLDDATNNCQAVVEKATEEAAAEAANTPSEPEAPRYDWRQPAQSNGLGRISEGGAPTHLLSRPDSGGRSAINGAADAQCATSEVGGGFWVLTWVAAVSFAAWFIYPRCEPHIRRLLGPIRHDHMCQVATEAVHACARCASRLTAAVSVVTAAIVLARNPNRSTTDGIHEGGSTLSTPSMRPSRLPIPSMDEGDDSDLAGLEVIDANSAI
jgi:hypothetical protein